MGRILFVGGESAAAMGLRGDGLGPGWALEFAATGPVGLDWFNDGPFDVVVADLWMPGMAGAEFLQEVMARHPGTLRILLADAEDRDLALQCLGRAHRFLTRPCDLAYLRSIIEFSQVMGARVGNDHARELVARIGQLPAVPDTYREILAALNSDRSSTEACGRIIGKDLAMTAAILKLSNSAFFSLRHEVTSPTEAVAYLGIDLLKSLVLAYGLFGQVGAFRVPTFTLHHLWVHSLAVAASAKRIADAEGALSQRGTEFFTAGLLHDVGILILASRLPEDYARVLALLERAGGDLETAEYHVFGTTHSEVGAYLLTLWGLPVGIIEAAAYHHLPGQQSAKGFSAALAVHVADALHSRHPDHPIFAMAHLEEAYLAELGLDGCLPQWKAAVDA